jgi:methylated-DNA-[protein]-cysteine S-methyltransferase
MKTSRSTRAARQSALPAAPLLWSAFETPLGNAALVWSDADADAKAERRIRGALLPGEATPAAVLERFPGATESPTTPAWIRAIAKRLVAHLRGAYDPLTDVALDLDGASPFDQAVWAAAREIPPGEVLSYGDLASRLGRPGAARAVGGAMGRNRVPFIIPCHRVVAASGLGGFSSSLGLTTKIAMLRAEGVDAKARKVRALT